MKNLPLFKKPYTFNKEQALMEEQEQKYSDDLSNIASFSEAFRIARQRGLSQFKWKSTKGNPSGIFGTQLASEVKKDNKPKPKSPKKEDNKADGKSTANKPKQDNFSSININYPKVNLRQATIGVNPFHQENPLNMPITIKPGDMRTLPSSLVFGEITPNNQIPVQDANPNENLTMRVSPVPRVVDRTTLKVQIPQTEVSANYGSPQAVDDTTYRNYLLQHNIKPTSEQSQNEWDWIFRGASIKPNSYQQGGSLNMNEQQLQQAFIQFLAQKTGAKTQEELEAVIQQLGEQGLQQAYQEFMQMMQQQQVQAAKFGAKLNYIKSLRGQCPEGYEMQYFKSGGQLCKKCMKKQQEVERDSRPQNPVDEFKCGRKMKKKEQGGSVEFNKCGKKMKKKAEGGDIDYDKCGSKMKKKSKKQEGGTFDPKTYSNAVLAKCGTKLKEAAKGMDMSNLKKKKK